MKREIEEQEKVIFKSVLIDGKKNRNDDIIPVAEDGLPGIKYKECAPTGCPSRFINPLSMIGSVSLSIPCKIKKLSETAQVPTKNNEDAGWDLYADEDIVIKPQERETIKTNISMEIPNGYVGLIWPRSGLGVKKGIDVFAGVIDPSYRGEIMVCLYNSNHDRTKDLYVKRGDRIAQMLFHIIPQITMVESNELSDTSRKDKGFGSSGD